MRMVANCAATSVAGSWSEPILGWDSFADCWFVMSSCSPPTVPSSILPACGLPSGGIFETRSSDWQKQTQKQTQKQPRKHTQTFLSRESSTGQVNAVQNTPQATFWRREYR